MHAFRECSSRKKDFSPRGKFTPLYDRIAWKVNSPWKNARERHVYPPRPMFSKGGLISPRYRMKFTRDNFTSPRGRFFSSRKKIVDNFSSPRNLTRKRHVSLARPIFPRGRPSSSREEVAEGEKHVRCIICLVVSPGQSWHVLQHKIFPKGYPGPRRGGCRGKEQLIEGSSLMYLWK